MGAIAVLWLRLTIIAFIMIAAWAIVTGALMLAAAFRVNFQNGRWWLLLSGAASVVFGALLILAPLAGAVVLTWWLGAYALVFGGALLVLAFRLQSRRSRDATPPGVHVTT